MAVACLAAAGCGHRAAATRPLARDPAASPLRVAILPLDNESGAPVQVRELQAVIERRLAPRFEVVTGPAVEAYLSRHRLRYTGGIDAAAAREAREELGLDGLVLTTLEAYRAGDPPVFGLTMRIVSTGEQPEILWMEHATRGGEDRPGLLRLGVLTRIEQVRDLVLDRIIASLDRALRGEDGGGACGPGRLYRPRIRFRSTLLDDGRPYSVAVVPFLNKSARRNAGDLLALDFVRQLVATGRFRVLEPGVVRDYMLRARIMVPGGVSLETTRLFMGALGVDLVVSGVVLDYQEATGPQGPTLRFSATMLDAGSGELVWNSSSFNHGDDGVFMFGLGRVRTAGELTCRMVASVVDRLGRRGSGDLPPHMADLGIGPGSRLGRRGGEPARR